MDKNTTLIPSDEDIAANRGSTFAVDLAADNLDYSPGANLGAGKRELCEVIGELAGSELPGAERAALVIGRLAAFPDITTAPLAAVAIDAAVAAIEARGGGANLERLRAARAAYGDMMKKRYGDDAERAHKASVSLPDRMRLRHETVHVESQLEEAVQAQLREPETA